MVSGMADFGRQRTLGQAIGFALFWTLIQAILAMASGALLAAFMGVLLGNANSLYGVAAISLLGRILLPTLIGFLTVYRKWGKGNALNILLYVLVVILAVSPLGILEVVPYSVLATRSAGRHAPTSSGARLILLLMLVLPLALLVRGGFVAHKVATGFQTHKASYEVKMRDIQRGSDLNTILSAVHLYAIDHSGNPIEKIPEADIEICQPHAADCTGMLDLAKLLDDYPIPVDATAPPDSKGTRYAIRKSKDPKGQKYLQGYLITVTALDAEGGGQVTAAR